MYLYPSYDRKHKIGGSLSNPGQKGRPYLKNTQSIRAGDMAQVVECLPKKHEALSSNSIVEKKENQICTISILAAILYISLRISIIKFNFLWFRIL
jgi:hypothetical protein